MLPIFLWIVAILVQYALMMNAKISIDNAAAVTARSAVTSLPDDRKASVYASAYMALEPISPKATTATIDSADQIYDALQATGVDVAESFPARFTYAANATKVTWTPDIDYTKSKGRELTVSLVYRFYLTVPGAKLLVGSQDSVAGVNGRFMDIASVPVTVQTAHSMATPSDGNGWPN